MQQDGKGGALRGRGGIAWWRMRVLCRVISGALAQIVFFRIRSGGMHRVLRRFSSARETADRRWRGRGKRACKLGRESQCWKQEGQDWKFQGGIDAIVHCRGRTARNVARMHRHRARVLRRGAASNSWTGLRDTQTNPPIVRRSVAGHPDKPAHSWAFGEPAMLFPSSGFHTREGSLIAADAGGGADMVCFVHY